MKNRSSDSRNCTTKTWMQAEKMRKFPRPQMGKNCSESLSRAASFSGGGACCAPQSGETALRRDFWRDRRRVPELAPSAERRCCAESASPAFSESAGGTVNGRCDRCRCRPSAQTGHDQNRVLRTPVALASACYERFLPSQSVVRCLSAAALLEAPGRGARPRESDRRFAPD